MSAGKLQPLSREEAAQAREALGQLSADDLQRFIGWMVKSAEFSAKVADDVRGFLKARGGAR